MSSTNTSQLQHNGCLSSSALDELETLVAELLVFFKSATPGRSSEVFSCYDSRMIVDVLDLVQITEFCHSNLNIQGVTYSLFQ